MKVITLTGLATAALFLGMGPGAPTAARAQDAPNYCVSCHGALTVERLAAPVARFAQDVHAAKGFGCVACHGGDPSLAGFTGMDPAKGFVGKPAGPQLLQVCGRCHSDAGFMRRYNPALRVDQVAEYRSSVHGQRLTLYRDTLVATCTSCHPAHAIRPASDPQSSVHPLNVARTCSVCHADSTHMAGYRIPTNQLERYEQSVHWVALSERGDQSAPTCNDCHGNHGAAPPGVDWVGNVCGQCHSVMADYFAASPHSAVFTRLGVPGCALCHGNHQIQTASDTLLGVGEGSVCSRCHVEGEGGGIVAAAMRVRVDSLRAAHGVADSLLQRAERAGMEVSQARFDLSGAQTALVQAQAAVHAFSLDSVAQHADEGLQIAAAAAERGHEALGELRFRRIGLTVSTGLILLLIIGVILKIRQIEA